MLVFIWLITMIYSCTICYTSPRIFDTVIISKNSNTFDCLIIPISAKLSKDYRYGASLPSSFEEIQQYCRRSISSNYLDEINYPTFTFNHLRSMGITYQELYEWNAPTDVIEDYISGKQIGLFVNCSNSWWFGSKCEYTFDSNEELSNIINDQYIARKNLPNNLSLYTNGTCYEMNNTNCESIICLDWREICDGKIDCKNGYDEHYCQQLEMNECNTLSELRCYDGQCIDNSLNFRLLKNTCLLDYSYPVDKFIRCYQYNNIRCENQKCPRLFFSCGDGYCYDGPSIGQESCHSQRDQRYLEKMSSSSSSLTLFSHVIINYTNTSPEYICYNQTLCPYLRMTTYKNDLICHPFKMFTNRTYSQLNEMVKDVKRLVYSCSLLPLQNNHFHNNCSMFQCNDRSKCLSFHRLSDGIEDCANGEDEHQIDICSRNLTGRFTCDNGTKCFSEQLLYDGTKHCIDATDENPLVSVLTRCNHPFSSQCYPMVSIFDNQIVKYFHICNGLIEYGIDSNNNTDESDCLITEWSCDAYYSKCDNVWNCPDGHDELGCKIETRSSLFCNNSQHFCLQNHTGQPMCLSMTKINDNIIDCVGSFDERKFCRYKYPFEPERRFRCQNSNLCISIRSICDHKQNCPENDDEIAACYWVYDNGRDKLYDGRCYDSPNQPYDGISDLFCDLSDKRNGYAWNNEQIEKSSLIATKHRIKRQSTEDYNSHVLWSCNRGIYVQSKKDLEGFACFCSDYYYGHRCQYQRKRVTLILQMTMLTAFNPNISTSIFIALLIHTNKSNITIISHVQFLNIPRYECQSSLAIQLLYPMFEPYRSWTNHSIHLHMFDRHTLQQQKSWNFSLSFEFLPVQQLFKRLDLPEPGTNFESRRIPMPYQSCTTCSNNSLCIGHDVSLDQDICICLPGYVGRRCLLPFNPCNSSSCNEHGICEPTGIYYEIDDQFICLCDRGWHGKSCEESDPYINVSLGENLKFLSSTIAFLHTVSIDVDQNVLYHQIYLQRFQKEKLNLTFIFDRNSWLPDIIFIQFYEHQYKFDYYLLSSLTYNQPRIKNMTFKVQSLYRCRSINELFNTTILAQLDIRRIKNYQRPCLQQANDQDHFLCFYDHDLMCICRENNSTACFHFQTNLNTCDKQWCYNRGMCVKDDETCPTSSQCICEPCSYGSYCQFTSGGYILSLDGIIGSHISLTVTSFFQQSQIVQIAIGLISILVLISIILNILSTSTFIQKETHEVGCGFYLLISSIIGLFTAIILILKMILLLYDKQNNVSCSIIAFFLQWCSKTCEWLNACVALERTIAVKRKIQYSRLKSKYFSKWITIIVLLLIGCICMPELFFRRIVIDHIDQRAWCVLTLNNEQPVLFIIYSILNILAFLIPLITNISSGIIIIATTFESKKKTNMNNQNRIQDNMSWRRHLQLIRIQILKHKHILIGPIILGILSLPRLILTFKFVCTKLDQNSISSLIAYLVGFLPTMAIIFAFIWPSQTYRSALFKSLKMIIPKIVQNFYNSHQNQVHPVHRFNQRR